MRKLLIFIILCLLSACSGTKKHTFIQKKNTAWCVNVCMESMFSKMHNQSLSKGTTSSSMNGITQNNVFIEVKNYCESFYEETCYMVIFDDPLTIHRHGVYGTSNVGR